MNPLGVCTWIFGNQPLDEIARRLAVLNFDGVELMGDLGAYQAAETTQILRAYQLEIFSLTPDNVDLAHPDETIRAEAIDYYLRLLDFAAASLERSRKVKEEEEKPDDSSLKGQKQALRREEAQLRDERRQSREKRKLEEENIQLKKELEEKYKFENMVGKCQKMKEIYSLIEKIAGTDSTVLVMGESGTGFL